MLCVRGFKSNRSKLLNNSNRAFPKALNLKDEAASRGNIASVVQQAMASSTTARAQQQTRKLTATDVLSLLKLQSAKTKSWVVERRQPEACGRRKHQTNVQLKNNRMCYEITNRSAHHCVQTSPHGRKTSAKADGVFVAIGTALSASGSKTIGKQTRTYSNGSQLNQNKR
ncbi:hypothetical protein AAHH84_00120 [Candidatus Hodgkinia cicadicola]